MTNQEAISLLCQALAEIEWTQPMEYAAAIDEAIVALEEQEKGQKRINTLYHKIKAHWNRRRQQADATNIELKFLVELLDWLEADEPPKEGDKG